MPNPLRHLPGLFSHDKGRRLRGIGALVLLLAVPGAITRYIVDVRTMGPALDELNAPGYLRARNHEISVLMGPIGGLLTDVEQLLEQPLARALIVFGAFAIVSFVFFRAATAADDEP